MKRIFINLIAITCLFPIFDIAWSAPLAVGRSQHTEARLITKSSHIQPGALLTLGLLLQMDKGWHTYWVNPGDSGMATKIDWQLPAGFIANSTRWPIPQRLPSGPLMSYGYSGEVLLLNSIQVPTQLKPGQTIRIKALAKWLECKEICLPGKAQLAIDLPVSQNGSIERQSKWLSRFQKAEALLPQPYFTKKKTRKITHFFYHAQDKTLELSIPLSTQIPLQEKEVYFFPKNPGKILHAKSQKVQKGTNSLRLFLEQNPNAKEIQQLKGVLFLGTDANKKQSYAIEIEAQAKHTFFSPQVWGESTSLLAIAMTMLLAFIGGLLLNLMPCVLPVLSIKVLHLTAQQQASWQTRLLMGLSYAGGVIFSFWLLVGSLWFLRLKGEAVGWGFQLQSPGFVFFLSLFLFAFALNLLGVFEIGLSLTRLSFVGRSSAKEQNVKQNHNVHPWTSFFSGCLATIVATPCTAPFMGSAVGYALVQPSFSIAFLIFTSLGVGMAIPFVLLSAFPILLRFVPQPGPWMEDLKKLLGFLLLGTVIWLLWLLARLANLDYLIQVLVSALVLALAAWIYGRWGQVAVSSSIRTRLVARGISCVLLLTAISPLFWQRQTKTLSSEIAWETYSPERAEALHRAGRTVLINFTADWCLSCKVNELLVFDDQEVQERIKLQNLTTLKADWTHYDPVITRALANYNRSGVPVYVLLHKGKTKPHILPEILTKTIFLKALDTDQSNP